MGAAFLEWSGVPIMLAASLILLGKRLDASHLEGAWVIGILLFSRAYDVIAEQVGRLPYSDVAVWSGSEFVGAGILMPAAGMPTWAGWALVVVGLFKQAIYAARLSWPPSAGPRSQHQPAGPGDA